MSRGDEVSDEELETWGEVWVRVFRTNFLFTPKRGRGNIFFKGQKLHLHGFLGVLKMPELRSFKSFLGLKKTHLHCVKWRQLRHL